MPHSAILTKLKAWCLLVLAGIAAQALVPVSAPEARTTGSPFNPATIDVSTGHARRDELPRILAPDDGEGGKLADAPARGPAFAALARAPEEVALASSPVETLRAACAWAAVSSASGQPASTGQPRAPPCT